jgi:hypothetical protein
LGGAAVVALPVFFGRTEASALPLSHQNAACRIPDGAPRAGGVTTTKYLAIGTLAAMVFTYLRRVCGAGKAQSGAEWIGKDR